MVSTPQYATHTDVSICARERCLSPDLLDTASQSGADLWNPTRRCIPVLCPTFFCPHALATPAVFGYAYPHTRLFSPHRTHEPARAPGTQRCVSTVVGQRLSSSGMCWMVLPDQVHAAPSVLPSLGTRTQRSFPDALGLYTMPFRNAC